jgi:hypothetical protein
VLLVVEFTFVNPPFEVIVEVIVPNDEAVPLFPDDEVVASPPAPTTTEISAPGVNEKPV